MCENLINIFSAILPAVFALFGVWIQSNIHKEQEREKFERERLDKLYDARVNCCKMLYSKVAEIEVIFDVDFCKILDYGLEKTIVPKSSKAVKEAYSYTIMNAIYFKSDSLKMIKIYLCHIEMCIEDLEELRFEDVHNGILQIKNNIHYILDILRQDIEIEKLDD